MDIAAFLDERRGIRLDIACGMAKQSPDWVGLDRLAMPGVDIVWDINDHPWPLPDECVIQALASHIVEHIPACSTVGGHTRFMFIEFMDEVWRILRPEAQFALSYPHGNSQVFLQDPTHCHAMNEVVWAYFDPLEPNTRGLLYKFYHPKPWKITHLSWSPMANVEVVLVKRRDDRSYHE
jgi:hypothetical protein